MKIIRECIICKSKDFTPLFEKASAFGERFTLVKCRECGLEFLHEMPLEDEIEKYYKREYFTKRTDRGYDDYFSDSIRKEIERVFVLNLNDLGFFRFEERLPQNRSMLDIGCAAGYFVRFMKERGWNATGVDISVDCVDFAIKSNLNVIQGDFLEIDFQHKFNLITLWATIEHLFHPDLVLEKIHKHIQDEGMLYISTCRTGGFNFMRLFGKRWRFYNFPEHIYFFSFKTLKMMLEQSGFRIVDTVTYGSGFGNPGTVIRKAADFCAKKFDLGDMMLVSARKMLV